MADTVLTVLLLAAAGATLRLTAGAVRHWRGQRAGRPYELPVDHRGTALRAAGAAAAAVTASALGAALLTSGGPAHPPAVRAAAPVRPSPSVPPPPPRTPMPAPPAPEVRTLGHPSGGTLQVLRDGTRVWLPPRYDSPRAADLAYPVVVAYGAADPSPGTSGGRPSGSSADPSAHPSPNVSADPYADMYAGFVQAADRHKADLFVLVTPPACPPAGSGAAVPAEVGAHYRVLGEQSARGVLGAGPGAACALRDVLGGAPGRYGAAAGVSGTYPRPSALAPAAGPHPPLLLVTAAGESGLRAGARRLRDALRYGGRPGAVHTVGGVGTRRQEFAEVAAYFTEKLYGPSRQTRGR